MRNKDEQVARLRDYLTADPDNSELACDLLDLLASQGRSTEARDTLAHLPEGVRRMPGVRYRAVQLALSNGDYGLAGEECAVLLDEGHDGLAVRHALAFSQLCRKLPQAALETVADAVARFGDDVHLAILRARAALMDEQFEAALEAARVAVGLDPSNASAVGIHALVLLDSGDRENADIAARTCIERYPEQHEARLVAGTLALWQNRADLAQEHFERALSTHPNSGRALSGYGQTWLLRGNLNQAEQVLRKAVRAMPDHIGTWHAMAWAQLLQGNRDAAEESYRQAYDLDRNFGDTHGGYALVAALKGDIEAANQSIRRALRLDPDSWTARYAQVVVMQQEGNERDAESAMEQLLEAGSINTPMAGAEFAQRLRGLLQTSGV